MNSDLWLIDYRLWRFDYKLSFHFYHKKYNKL